MSASDQIQQSRYRLPAAEVSGAVRQRRKQLFQLAGAGLFAGILLICSAWQWHAGRTLQHELEAIAPIHESSHQRTVQLTTLKQELTAAEQRADLLTYLQHPWPKTQLIAAVLEPMPKSIKLSELTLARQEREAGAVVLPSQRSRNTPTAPKTDEAKAQLTPAQSDLKLLRTEFDPRESAIFMSGETTDVSELHEYLGELGQHPLIVKAELRSIEGGRESSETRFRARIVVRAGYGQPNGPAPADPPASAGDHTRRAASPGQPSAVRGKERVMKKPARKVNSRIKNSNLIFLLPLIGVGVGYLLLLFLPNYREMNKKREMIQLQQDFITKTEGLKGEISDLQAQLDRTQKYCQEWQVQAPADADIPQIHRKISECVSLAGAAVTGFEPQPPVELETLERSAHPAPAGTFPQIHDMLAKLEALPETLWMENLRLQAGGKDEAKMNCEVTVVVFAKKSEKSD